MSSLVPFGSVDSGNTIEVEKLTDEERRRTKRSRRRKSTLCILKQVKRRFFIVCCISPCDFISLILFYNKYTFVLLYQNRIFYFVLQVKQTEVILQTR